MDAGKFLEVNGPWGLIGLLLFILWDLSRRQEKSTSVAVEKLQILIGNLITNSQEMIGLIRDVCEKYEAAATPRRRVTK